jgi:hypothetical protein
MLDRRGRSFDRGEFNRLGEKGAFNRLTGLGSMP